MKAISKIAIFLPKANAFYTSLIFQMKRGLEAHGVDVWCGLQHMDEVSLLGFCREWKPDVIFEMNRTRNEIPSLPKDIKHIAWVVDTNGRYNSHFKGSEIIYFIGHNWMNANQSTDSFVDFLPPGVCPQVYFYSESDQISDFSFVGHIPLPWDNEDKNRIIANGSDGQITFGDLLEQFIDRIEDTKKKYFTNDTYIEVAIQLIKEILKESIILNMDDIMRYDIGCRTIRMLYRKKLVDLILQISKDIRIFGSSNWEKWPEYKDYYISFLSNPLDIRNVYQTSRINLHEGVALHFRSIDCLASGGLLFYFEDSPADDANESICRYFEPDRHFILFNKDNLAEKARYYLSDEQSRRKIGQSASHETMQNHTWHHRWRKILSDIKRL